MSESLLHARYLAVAGLLLNAFLWGISWLPFRWLQERGLQSLWTTALIYLIALVLVSLVNGYRKARRRNGVDRERSPHEEPVRAQERIMDARIALLWLGIAAGLANACFNWAVTIGSVVRVVLLFYLMPIWSTLLARWLLNEAITAGALARIAIGVAGAAIVLWRPQLGMPLPQSLPDWLAIAGGAAFALTNVMLRLLGMAGPGQADPGRRAQAMFAGSCLIPGALALMLAATQTIGWPSADVGRWLPAAVVVALVFMAANLGLQYGAARLPAAVTAVVMISEVLFATGSSLLFGQERLTLPLIVGGSLVLLSAWSAARADSEETAVK